MPLPTCSTRKAYSAILYTFGPIDPADKDACRMQVHQTFTRLVGHNMKPGEFIVAFEESDDGYRHCHVAVGFINPQKPNMGLVVALKTLCAPDNSGRRPNLGMNHVPKLAKGEQGSGTGAYALLHKYLTDPHKVKTTDEGALEFTFPEHIDHVSTFRRLADKENDPKRRRYYETQHTLAKLRVQVNNPAIKKKRRTLGEAEAARRVLADQEKKLMLPEKWS